MFSAWGFGGRGKGWQFCFCSSSPGTESPPFHPRSAAKVDSHGPLSKGQSRKNSAAGSGGYSMAVAAAARLRRERLELQQDAGWGAGHKLHRAKDQEQLPFRDRFVRKSGEFDGSSSLVCPSVCDSFFSTLAFRDSKWCCPVWLTFVAAATCTCSRN